MSMTALCCGDRSLLPSSDGDFSKETLREIPKQLGTLSHYLSSYTSFLKFAKSYSLSLRCLMTMEQQDINEIDATLVSIKNWAKIINKDKRRRAHELRLHNKQSLIAPEAYQRVLDCDKSLRVRNDFLQLSADSVITENIYIEFRDYLIVSLQLRNMQRPSQRLHHREHNSKMISFSQRQAYNWLVMKLQLE